MESVTLQSESRRCDSMSSSQRSQPDRPRTGGAPMRRDVAAHLEVDIPAPTTLEFQIAVAPHPNASVDEVPSFVLDGASVQPMEIIGTHGNRIQKLDAPIGLLTADYTATIIG